VPTAARTMATESAVFVLVNIVVSPVVSRAILAQMAFVSRSGGQRLRARFVEHRRDTSNVKAQAAFHRESPVESVRWSTLCAQRSLSFDCFVIAKPQHRPSEKSGPIACFTAAKRRLKRQESSEALAPAQREGSGEHQEPALGGS
jgi:hypothetical protein